MIRSLAAAAAGMLFVAGAGGAGATMETARAVLSPPVVPGTAGVSVGEGPASAAVLRAPASTAMLAMSDGAVVSTAGVTPGRPSAPAHLTVRGGGDDTGLDVEVTGLADVTAAPSVQRGDVLGRFPAGAGSDVIVQLHLDGAPVDAVPLLRAALGGELSDAGEWTRPVDGAVVSQAFGCTIYAFEPVDHACPSGHIHTGIDLAVPLGTPVRAALPGTVQVIVSATGFGLHVIVDHGGGLATLYGHLQSVVVHDGDAVDAGDLLGLAGSTGNSTGPHLHFEVRRDGIPEDPTLDLALP
jgi:hypothetical protein